MKRVILSLAAVGMITASISAQEAPKTQEVQKTVQHEKHKKVTPKERADFATKKLHSVCELSAEQQTKIQTINEAYFTKQQRKKEELRAMNKERKESVKQVLTPEQAQKLKAHREANKQDVKGKMDNKNCTHQHGKH